VSTLQILSKANALAKWSSYGVEAYTPVAINLLVVALGKGASPLALGVLLLYDQYMYGVDRGLQSCDRGGLHTAEAHHFCEGIHWKW